MVTQKEIFYQYLINERTRLEEDVVQLRQNQRMKKNIDAVDCLELALSMERLSAFIDYSDHALAIFKLNVPTDYRASIVNIDFSAYKQAAERLKKELKKEKAGR